MRRLATARVGAPAASADAGGAQQPFANRRADEGGDAVSSWAGRPCRADAARSKAGAVR